MTPRHWLASVIFTFLALPLAIGDGARAATQNEQGNDLSYLSTRSNLIFVGKVVSVSHTISQTGGDGTAPLPFTLVTYTIEQVVHGTLQENSFTMRFIGGPDNRGNILTVTGVPHFQVNERDLLFVSSNGAQSCPLVLCQWGRYRILKGDVYTHQGVPVQDVAENRAIAFGSPQEDFSVRTYPAPSFEELLRDPSFRDQVGESAIPLDELRILYEKYLSEEISEQTVRGPRDQDNADDEVIETNTPSAPRSADTIRTSAISLDQFLDKLRVTLINVNVTPQPLRSIDANEVFSASSPPESGAPLPEAVRTDDDASDLIPSPSDIEELRLLERHGYNPVIEK